MAVRTHNHTRIGVGTVSAAFYSRTDRGGAIVFKVVNPTNRWNKIGATAAQIANEVVWACELLRTHPLIVSRFGPTVVPKTWSPRPGIVAQELGVGVHIMEVPDHLQGISEMDLDAMDDIAKTVLGGTRRTDMHAGNVLFDPVTGRLSCVFDPLFPLSAVQSLGNYAPPKRRPK